MSEVKRYDPINSDGTCGTCVEDPDYGAYVEFSDYAALEAECERLRAQVSALRSDANSWQSGYDKGREDGAKAAEGWKAQHARDSAELRRLCAERDALRAELERFSQANRELSEKNVRRREQVRQLRAELAAIKGQEPAGVVHFRKGGGIAMLQVELNTPLPPGTKLYTLPAASEGGDV